jgi:hypothetical protein
VDLVSEGVIDKDDISKIKNMCVQNNKETCKDVKSNEKIILDESKIFGNHVHLLEEAYELLNEKVYLTEDFLNEKRIFFSEIKTLDFSLDEKKYLLKLANLYKEDIFDDKEKKEIRYIISGQYRKEELEKNKIKLEEKKIELEKDKKLKKEKQKESTKKYIIKIKKNTINIKNHFKKIIVNTKKNSKLKKENNFIKNINSKYIICECGKKINKGVKFCPNCGCKIYNGTIRCSCGSVHDISDKFCPNCGENTQKILKRKL